MKKVRVYELAKEAGIESKIMVAKLIELGYAIKSYSSTLDPATAAEIRLKLKIEQSKTEEKLIQSKRRTTIIRRKSRSVVSEKVESEKPQIKESVIATTHKKIDVPEPVDVAAKKPDVIEADKTADTGKEKERSRIGLARIIKKATIVIPPAKVPQPRPKKVIKNKDKPTESVKRQPERASTTTTTAKGKKGKRFVKFHTEPESRDRTKKSTGKRRRQVDVEMEDIAALGGRIPAGLKVGRGLRPGRKGRKGAEETLKVGEVKAAKKRIKVMETITVTDLAHRMGAKASEVIAKLMNLGVMATLNQAMDVDTATLVAADFGYEIEQGITEEQTIVNMEEKESGGKMLPRPPVVTVMGHVDHGKTSILDAIRKTDVAAGEAGGITQHIGAHYVRSPHGDVVFLDTPGHAAFTEMRSRGAQITDVVILVVAADDGVMDQTKEAINHARAAKVPILVAINKIDKPDADPMRVKRELAEFDLMAEDWGGDVIFCETSAKKNLGISELLENILLQSEVLELKADPQRKARGYVVEAQLHKGRGPIATVLIQQGTLKIGDTFVVGHHYGRVRSLSDDKGDILQEAGPAIPVEVQGSHGVPLAGDEFVVVKNEKMAKSVSSERRTKSREVELASVSKISLDNLFEKLQEGKIKELRVALRADVQGTLEAFRQAIEKLSTDEIRVKILHEGTGTITESDVLLATASDALIIGFNVRPSSKVQGLADEGNVDIRCYDVIYHALDDIRQAMTGLLDPEFEEEVIGNAEVRETFHVPKVGTIAGCFVVDGRIERNAQVRVLRDGVVIYTGTVSSLKRFKDDAKEVQSGYECGIGIEKFNNIKVSDLLEFFVMKEIAPEL